MNRLIPLVILVCAAFASPTVAADDKWRSPESVEGANTTGLSQAKQLFDEGAVFIDARNPGLYAKGHIPGAYHLDFKNGFDESALSGLVARDRPVVIYCSGVKCSRSYRASAKAVDWGYSKVHYFRGGIVEWQQSRYPVKTGAER